MEYLDKYEVDCCDEDVVACLDEGVLTWLDKNNKDCFYVYFLPAHPLEYLLEETLDEKCLVQYGYMQKIGWYETYVHFCHHHNYKNLMIYQYHLNCGRDKGFSETYIYLYHQHQQLIQN